MTPWVRAAAASLLIPRGGAIAGRMAAWLHGADLLSAAKEDAVEVVVPPGMSMRPRRGIDVRTARLDEGDVVIVRRLPALRPIRIAFDLARWEPDLVEAVVLVDALARIGVRRHFTPAALLDYAAGRPGARGVSRLPEIVDLSDPLAESPMETRLRLLLVRSGLPRPVSQYEIYNDHDLLMGRVDLAYPQMKLAIEYDGEGHERRWLDDVGRQNQIFGEGWMLRRYTKQHVYRAPDLIVREIGALLKRAGLP
ncbi:DUF559 domain-containing protein [Planotetraspora sp. A-T 1434]|uniref:DUF559 domain-containing protein n=1 Tax=Planotetraspora sp. A-T 1434 TaxID=2979219 RepID=UPI0021C1AAD4|nr:DUF559 domain-containing protein [Planotetraspora sp. A-T 1434]MCT9935002.1 DUF559 domain-containing protein [Planotetraspora sp. A-T 1434]